MRHRERRASSSAPITAGRTAPTARSPSFPSPKGTIHRRPVGETWAWPGSRESSKPESDGYAEIAVRQMLQNGASPELWESTGLWAAPYGHSFMGDYHTDSRLVTALDHPVFREYRTALERRVGAEAAARILGVSRWNSIVYPSCSFMSQFRQLRIVQPLAVDRTLVSAYSFRLGGAPEQMFRDTVDWGPLQMDQAEPFTAASLIYDDRRLLEIRVRQTQHPRAHARVPAPRTVHQVTNVQVVADDGRELTVTSSLVMIEYRKERQRVWGGSGEHRLGGTDGGLLIAGKRGELRQPGSGEL